MKTIDFRKDPVYKATTEPQIIEVPDMLFVSVCGDGPPEDNLKFQEAMQILYGVVYTIKFWDKQHPAPKDYAKFSVAPLEGLWWMKDSQQFNPKKPGDWQWKVMIRLPDFVTPELFRDVVKELIVKKKTAIYKKALLEKFDEGACAQLMYIGPYDKEEPDINRLHDFATKQGYKLVGKHHELYFSDPRRTKPENLKTLIRQPVQAS